MLLLFFLLSFPFLLSSAPTPTPSPKPNPNPNNDPFLSGVANFSYNIDCGGTANFTSSLGRAWLSDRFFSAGNPGMVAEPHRFSQPQERTLRFFPPVSSGKKNCYSVPVPSGRYYIRTFTVYDNYDAKLRSPSFDVSVEGTLVFTWRSPWPEAAARSGAYSDLISPVLDAVAHVCFYSMATDPPVVASLEIAPVHPLAYDAASTGPDLILVNYGRLTAGGNLFGPGFTADPDAFSRVWQPDAGFRSPTVKIKALSAGGHQIFGSNQPPNYFPTLLYETAVTTVDPADALQYLLPVDTRLSYMIWFHFAEIDAGVNSAGRRVFDVVVGGNNVTRIDIFKEVGGFTAFKWHYIMENLTNTPLSVELVPVIGKPIICGLENYAMVPLDMATVPSQVVAMRALKESLRIPTRMGWNGDPCAPTIWDAWEGVTCHRSQDGQGLVVTQLDLASQGLKGYISDQISLLTNLVSLNLSSNSLGGTLPPGLGQESLVRLDLSSNQFSGSIPGSLGSSTLQIALLNNNELDGQVPERLYSIGVHGGVIDLSGKIAIGVSCGVVLIVVLLVIYIVCIRRGPNDYDFDFPQDFTSIAAKRNRYHRQKSLMLLEMETQNSNGLQSTVNTI
ncbi:putative leucine-rich repeat receptor-like serine/threonine-protein kinase At2g14440 isoform X2 [Ananas comosus]|uniref:Leucine-rich repeat receptor-like serine/threonine-protein kinase At2g14440 isoform X2 n=1 Tax=Ananas comosus TaxID=4615 RepID=A0A6P5FWJ9_ANACO|nr:putative leucine-rich repeat receptor-like serine/threonine-protein kinase At2g14440 isoform X2 [Ananas comosus]